MIYGIAGENKSRKIPYTYYSHVRYCNISIQKIQNCYEDLYNIYHSEVIFSISEC